MAQITCYDGVGCIGGNKILLEDGDRKLFFDFGTNFGAEGRFYEEFIRPKACVGLYEYIQMGLLPPLRDIYRTDMVSSVCDPWSGIAAVDIGDVGGVLVSHAHVDHMGSIRHLRGDIPVFCTPMTAAISRALQDTGKSQTETEYCYYVARTESDQGHITSPHWKTHPFQGRIYRITPDSVSDAFRTFWESAPGGRELRALDCELAELCAGLTVRSFPTDHSVYGASAWGVQTSAGWVVYSGDIRFHGSYGDNSRRFAEQAASLSPAALIIEGTRIDSTDSCAESDVGSACLDVVSDCPGLVVADFGPRNVERLMSFLDIARQTDRELVILPKNAYLLDAMRSAEGEQAVPSLDNGGIRIYREHSAAEENTKWKAHVAERHRSLMIEPSDISRQQDHFICCFGFFDVQELAYIKPAAGSVWISSNCEPFNEEMQIDLCRLKNWLAHFDVRYIGGDESAGNPFHVSGHVSGPDLFDLVRTIRPRKLIPIHSEHPEFYVENVGDVCEVVLPERGAPIQV